MTPQSTLFTAGPTIGSQHNEGPHDHTHLLCWRSIFAGLAMSIAFYVGLTALGAGVGGSLIHRGIEFNRDNGQTVLNWEMVWMVLAVMWSLVAGAYMSVRLTRTNETRVGGYQGLVIAALFLIGLFTVAGSTVSALGSGVKNLASGATTQASSFFQDPAVQDTLQRAYGDQNLKSNPRDVAEGLAVRLLRGDTTSARNFLAYQTGLSQTEVDARITQLQAQLQQAFQAAEDQAARAVATTGYLVFALVAFSLLVGVLGGTLAAHTNAKVPVDAHTAQNKFATRPATT